MKVVQGESKGFLRRRSVQLGPEPARGLRLHPAQRVDGPQPGPSSNAVVFFCNLVVNLLNCFEHKHWNPIFFILSFNRFSRMGVVASEGCILP